METANKNILGKVVESVDQNFLGRSAKLSDNRCAMREPYVERLSFSSKHGMFHGRSRDISTTGLFIETATELDLGARIEVILTFPSAPKPLRLSAMVTRKTEEGIGAYFEVLTQAQISEFKSVVAGFSSK